MVIDEVQHQPGLLPEIRAEVDTDRRSGRFLILGSAGPDIISGSSETLAGRIKYLYMHPFTMEELGYQHPLNDLFFWGGFPEVAPEICIEIKLSSAPHITKSFTNAIDDLKTSQNYIVIP